MTPVQEEQTRDESIEHRTDRQLKHGLTSACEGWSELHQDPGELQGERVVGLITEDVFCTHVLKQILHRVKKRQKKNRNGSEA